MSNVTRLVPQPRPPRERPRLPLPQNEYGHYLISITGVARSGALELELLEERGDAFVRESARDLLLSCRKDAYDCQHWLGHDREYHCALVPSIRYQRGESMFPCTTAGYLAFGQQFGYVEAKAGALFRIIERIPLQLLGPPLCYHVSPLVTSLKDRKGNPRSLSLRHYPGINWGLTATDGDTSHEWRDRGLLIYFIP